MISPVNNTVFRGADPTGYGWYGASRGNRKHKGVDVLTQPKDSIKAPFSGVITKFGQVYSQTNKFKYIELKSDVYRIRLMYAKPIDSLKLNQRIFEGDEIGIAQDIAGYWKSGMLNHIHIELYKNGLLTDPEPLII